MYEKYYICIIRMWCTYSFKSSQTKFCVQYRISVRRLSSVLQKIDRWMVADEEQNHIFNFVIFVPSQYWGIGLETKHGLCMYSFSVNVSCVFVTHQEVYKNQLFFPRVCTRKQITRVQHNNLHHQYIVPVFREMNRLLSTITRWPSIVTAVALQAIRKLTKRWCCNSFVGPVRQVRDPLRDGAEVIIVYMMWLNCLADSTFVVYNLQRRLDGNKLVCCCMFYMHWLFHIS